MGRPKDPERGRQTQGEEETQKEEAGSQGSEAELVTFAGAALTRSLRLTSLLCV